MIFMVPRAQKRELGFRAALDKACSLAAVAGTREAAVVVHVRRSADSGILRDAIGDKATNELVKGATTWQGIQIHLVTERIRSAFTRGPMIAAYVAPRLVERTLADKRATDVIFLPWNSKEDKAFYDEHHPSILAAPPDWRPGIDTDSLLFDRTAEGPQPTAASATPNSAKPTQTIVLTADARVGKPHVVLLGAGASLAAFPSGDRNGKRLPLMSNLTELLPLEGVVPDQARRTNFEAYYSAIAEEPAEVGRVAQIQQVVYDYFGSLVLPSRPTIYDYLILGLRPKDVIATFNWDPFLLQAARRNASFLGGQCPQLLFLHGNVMEGVCHQDRVLGIKGALCSGCGKPLQATKLLYPIGRKNYSAEPALASTWNTLAAALKAAFMVTVFGYSAPASDVDAVALLKVAWGEVDTRQFEQFEIIDIRGEKALRQSWAQFIHTHHYEVHRDFFASTLAKHPRRTGEDFFHRYLQGSWTQPNPPPQKLSLFELQRWFQPFIDAERAISTDAR